jgi:hypothetical protein
VSREGHSYRVFIGYFLASEIGMSYFHRGLQIVVLLAARGTVFNYSHHEWDDYKAYQ